MMLSASGRDLAFGEREDWMYCKDSAGYDGRALWAQVSARLVVVHAYAVDDRDLVCTHLSYCVLKSEGEVSQNRPPDQ